MPVVIHHEVDDPYDGKDSGYPALTSGVQMSQGTSIPEDKEGEG